MISLWIDQLVPKFLRDSYIVTDIQGTSSKKKVVEHPRDPMKLVRVIIQSCHAQHCSLLY